MIGRLRGALVAKTADAVVVDVGGVGHEVAMTPGGVAALPPVGDDVVIHTHLHVREDQLALFGFTGAEERDLFRVLLGASGVGPKLALAILGTLPPNDLKRAVLTEDAAALTTVPESVAVLSMARSMFPTGVVPVTVKVSPSRKSHSAPHHR